MTQEDKQLLLKDLSGRLPYTVFIKTVDCSKTVLIGIKDGGLLLFDDIHKKEYYRLWNIECCKPYLRPMSSMTKEEKSVLSLCNAFIEPRSIELKLDFYNMHHLDFRGLIEKGLAIEVTEDNNPYEILKL